MNRAGLFAAGCGLVFLSLACSRSAGNGDTPAPPSSAPQLGDAGDKQTVERLEREAKALAKTDGCANDSQCRAAPVGAKACGGPRYYLSYCAATTDSAALFRKLDELAQAERARNQKEGIISDCSFVTEPQLQASGGQCRVRP